jgi:hypothetical protein
MSRPSNTTITIDGAKFNAMTAQVSFATVHDGVGMPMIGTTQCAIECVVDMHDNVNLPYGTLQKLFELSNGVTKDKIKSVKIEFWQDEKQTDALCTYTFQGWISNFATGSGGGGNHTLWLSIQPELDKNNFIKVTMGN